MTDDDLKLLREDLLRDEGERFEAYKDSVGLWTIGVGHLLGTRERMTDITPAESRALLDGDIQQAMRTADRWVPEWRSESGGRARALVNLAFNLGNNLEQFVRFRTAVAMGDWQGAARELADSRWAQQVGARAKRIQDAITSEA